MSRHIISSWESGEKFSQSIQMHVSMIPISQKLSALKSQSTLIGRIFQQFKDETLNRVNKAMGRITSFIQREITMNAQLKEELDIVKHSNQTMAREVLQLREMINQCVKSYNIELQAKDAQIRELRMQLGHVDEKPLPPFMFPCEQPEEKKTELEVIHEVSEYTGSCLQSIREISIPNSAKGSIIPVDSNQSNLSETHEDSWAEEDRTNKSKSYLNFFRKNIDESVIIYEQKEKQKQQNSHSSSIEDLHLGDTDKINLPKSIKSPKNMQFLKKSSKKFSIEEVKQNISFVEVKRTPHRRNYSQGDQKSQCKSEKHSRSHSKTGSKEKIKITSKMVDQFNNFNCKNTRKTNITTRPSVHLGGKAYLKKLVKQVRTALQEYKVWEGTRSRQVKYEGEKKSGMRWGKGRLLYDNGFQYDGNFAQNYKHGIGTISLNGMVFYEGQWSLDEISGQGYIKSLKNYSQNCPKYLWQASYCGQLLENKPHGMGTLFINQNEKVVTKFVHGMPVGDFTYYSHSQIQFGSWY